MIHINLYACEVICVYKECMTTAVARRKHKTSNCDRPPCRARSPRVLGICNGAWMLASTCQSKPEVLGILILWGPLVMETNAPLNLGVLRGLGLPLDLVWDGGHFFTMAM